MSLRDESSGGLYAAKTDTVTCVDTKNVPRDLQVLKGVLDQAATSSQIMVIWQPGSDSHFAVLTTDNCLQLDHVDKLAEPEQTFEFQTSTER
ncbi:hypothetical protein WJX82_006461 [Trebouxia sp. C0006]